MYAWLAMYRFCAASGLGQSCGEEELTVRPEGSWVDESVFPEVDSFLAGTITPRQSARDPAEVEWAYLLLVQDRLAWVGFPPRMVLAMPKDVVLDAVLGGSVEIVMCRACVRELFARRQPRSTIKQ